MQAVIPLTRNTVQILQDVLCETRLRDDTARTAIYAAGNDATGDAITKKARMKMQNKRQCQARDKTNTQGVGLSVIEPTKETTCIGVVSITSL